MDPNEEIEDLELDPNATEEIADEGIEAPAGYKGNNYHTDRINELNEKSDKLKEKVEGLKEEKEEW